LGARPRKFLRNKADIRVCEDEYLGKPFEADVSQRFGGNASCCMDAILWNLYGKSSPRFETPKEADTGPDAWSLLHSKPESTYED
jgi:hypothetical protein